MSTAKQQLLELTYEGDLWGDITGWLAAGRSWRDIRHEVETRTGLHVSHESLRMWHKELTEADAA
jgi:hypothetical protein